MNLRYHTKIAAKILALTLLVALGLSASAKTKFKVLYNFKDGTDGANPILFATLAMDKSGNLFGATPAGGDIKNRYCEGYGCGVVFELSPSGKR